MRRSRPAVARRLSIRAPAPAPAPPANRISSRRHCVPATLKRIRFSRCENDAFLPRARPAPAGRGRIARRRTPTDPLITLLPHYHSTDHHKQNPTTDYRHYSDRSGAPPVAFHNKMFIFNNCRQIPDPLAARGAFKFSRCIWKCGLKTALCYLTERFNSKYVSRGHDDFDFANTAYEVILTIYLHAEMQWNRLVISCKMHFRLARLQLHSLSFRFHSNTIEQSFLVHL